MGNNALVARCQALTRKGTPCNQPALDNYPFCIHHIGGGTAINKAHDRYSESMPAVLAPHYHHQLQDDKPKDLTEEIANLRGLLRGLLAKKQNEITEDGKLPTISDDDIVSILQLTEGIGRMVERHAKVSPDRVITVNDVMRIVSRIIDIIHSSIPYEQMDIRGKIVEGINQCITELLAGATEHNANSFNQQ